MRVVMVVTVLAMAGCNATVQAGGCGPGNCTGCCTSAGQCVSGIEPGSCGSVGAACTNCTLSGMTCQLGACIQSTFGVGGGSAGVGGGSAGACGRDTCAGCCLDGVCQLGVFDSECGTGGETCRGCNEARCSALPKGSDGAPRGGRCLGGTGGGSASCSRENCPTGCCVEGVCQSGTVDFACGRGGDECVVCEQGAMCVAGMCQGSAGGGAAGAGGGGIATGGGFAGGIATGGGFAGGSTTGGGFAGGSTTGGGFAGGSTTGGGFAGGSATGGGFAGGSTTGGGFAGGSTTGGGFAGGSAGGVVSGTGETCATAVLLTSPGSRSGTLSGFVDDYGAGSGCVGTSGPDRVYRLQVGSAARVSVTVTPSSSWDVSVSATVGQVARCDGAPRLCDASANAQAAGAAETIDVATASGDDVFVVVDSSSTSVGAFTLSWSIQPLTIGDRCEAPFPLQSGVARNDSTFGFTNDYTAGTSCASLGRLGADVVYAVQVGPGQGLDVTVTPQGAMLDTSISIATSVPSCARQCVTGANTGAAGAPDVAFWNNVSGSTVTAYVIVDSSQGSSAGPFSIAATVGAQVTCNPARCPTGCCQSNQCVVGSEDTACGQQGNACQVCGQYQQCQNAVCTDAPRPTGAPCSMNSQCYGGTLASPVCRTTWPSGGYCSSTCLFDGFDCGGLPIIGPGWCVSNVCLEKCSSPGAGQSTCRSGYVCDFSAGAGSQGVCLPRCQSLPCGTGQTCQPSGYCR
ncbi:MAG: hypothetical protein JNJ54_15170 [Myxococcaceae bacterium]|nr:hypothetical protein [Myxococcaceae bacterium]